MARNKGQFKFAADFEVQKAGALDPRIVVDAKADLINKETWPYDGETLYLYAGLVVAVAADKALYMLVDVSKALESDYSGWKQLDMSAVTQIEVVDKPDSTGIGMTEKIFKGPLDRQLRDALSYIRNYIIKEKITKISGQAEAERIFNYPYEAVEESLSEDAGASEDGSEELTGDSEFPPSLEVAPPPHPAKENTSAMDNKSDNNFFILTIPFFLLIEFII